MYYESISLGVQRLVKVERWPRRLKFSAVFESHVFRSRSTTHQHHDLTGGKAIKHGDRTCLNSSLISSTCKLKKEKYTLPRSLYKAHEETCFLAVLTGRSRHSIILLEDSRFSDDNQNHN
jgi:hypothetical protein